MVVLDIHGVKSNDNEVLESFSSSEEFASEKVALKSALAAFNEATDGGYRCEISLRNAAYVEGEMLYLSAICDVRTYQKESV